MRRRSRWPNSEFMFLRGIIQRDRQLSAEKERGRGRKRRLHLIALKVHRSATRYLFQRRSGDFLLARICESNPIRKFSQQVLESRAAYKLRELPIKNYAAKYPSHVRKLELSGVYSPTRLETVPCLVKLPHLSGIKFTRSTTTSCLTMHPC